MWYKKSPTIRCFALIVFLTLGELAIGQTTTIPDISFEQYLETHNADGEEVPIGDNMSMGDGIANNGLVFTNRIDTVMTLNVSGLGITTLAGIADFAALQTLICADNNLAELDISDNTELTALICGSNNLTAIDVSGISNLESLNCSDNQIEVIDVTNNNSLKSLTISGNQIANIDVSNLIDLMTLGIADNRITGALDVSNNVNLEGLFCSSNQINLLDVSLNTNLKNLDVSNNSLNTLDLSTINTLVCPDPQTDPATPCQGFSTINVSNNQLTSLIVNNGFNDLVTAFNASDNPDLFCIQIDAGFVPEGWIKDDWTYYSDTVCVDVFTYVPDDNFEQVLINQGIDDVLDNLVLTANIDAITDLNVANENIVDLTGIEDFTALENFVCSTNALEIVNFSSNTNLVSLDLTNNELTELNLNSNTQLEALYCGNNFLEELSIDQAINLTTLNCSNNNLVTIDLNANLQIDDLDCSFNQIEQLDVSDLPNLISVLANNNNLFTINVANANNPSITTFDATNNVNLFCIEVDDVAFANGAAGWQKDAIADYNLNCGTYVPDDNFEQALIDQGIDSDNTLNNFVPTADVVALTDLNVAGLGISDLTGIEDFVALTNLNCSNNQILELDVSANLALQIIDLSFNEVMRLDVVNNTAITELSCNANALNFIDVANGNNANLVTFNAQNNPNLFCINVDNAVIGNIPPTWLKDDFADYNDDCINSRFTAIPDLFFEQVLIDQGFDDVIDGQVLTSVVEVIEILNVSNQGIADLTGIRDFKSLVELDCSSNFLDALDVSNLLFLERLNCSSNFLVTNNINAVEGLFNTTGTASLRELFCADNDLTDLNTSQNLDLEILDCANNRLTVLQVGNNTFLRRLNCSNNDLGNLDISNNDALESFNADSNQLSVLTTAAALNNNLTDFSCADNELNSLLIGNYPEMELLNCGSNQLTGLDVSANTALVSMTLTNNELNNLDLTNNTVLETLLVAQNELTALDLTTNTGLNHINCSFNLINEINLNQNTDLQRLYISSNELTVLDTSSNSNLIDLDASSNNLSEVNLSVNLSLLKSLNLSGNAITDALDLSNFAIGACDFQANQTQFCPENITINISNNLFDFVNLQNGINAEISNFNSTGNPNLECIQVDDPNNTGATWLKDEATDYSLDCNFGETFVPDDNFEQALIDIGLDVGPLNDFVPTANIEGVLNLNLNGEAIADLTGIEDFEGLEVLNISNNDLIELNLSQNLNLINLNCSNNQLSELDINQNTALSILDCSANALSILEVTQNNQLVDLDISNNLFEAFSPSDVLSLEVFSCSDNAITELDFQQNPNIASINCNSNLLEVLNLRNGQNAILLNLDAQNNPDLLCIETDNGTVPNSATWLVDTEAQLSIECFFGQTFVPDDNFEQALIDFGYDELPLDDYVLTENIESLTFLNISGRHITDLTGIEAFTSLTNLNISDNVISLIDLSANQLLINLDASGNLLTAIDLTFLPNLIDLDLESNLLTEISLNTNINLADLHVSNNQLTALDVGALTNLQDLNCASNQLIALDVTQNPSLELLFCQSNQLVADQLNLQNGNNENLQLFNATNNPGLSCILVDDPIAVITNVDGLYDNWLKDDSASYQTICADADNDGIPNEDDLCPSTPFGAYVDLFGCEIPNLPADNFTVSVTSETCLNSNNGEITIVAQELYAYTATLSNDDFYQEYNFTNDVDIFNLLAGTYSLCITIEEWPDYEVCYTVVITEPNPLTVFSNRLAGTNELSLLMTGSSNYQVELNGTTITTSDGALTLQLQPGENVLKVKTDLACQGFYEEHIFVSDTTVVYPNPVKHTMVIYNPVLNEDIKLNIYSSYGKLMLSKYFRSSASGLTVDLSKFNSGIYVVFITSSSKTSVHKIIKE